MGLRLAIFSEQFRGQFVGTSYYAIAGIGYKVDLDQVDLQQVIVHSCDHPERVGNKFCPKCGKQVYERVQDSRDLHWQMREAFEEAATEHKYEWHQIEYEKPVFFLGYGKCVGGYGDSRVVKQTQTDEQVKAVIEQIVATAKKKFEEGFAEDEDMAGDIPDLQDGINPDTFGLHVAMYAS